MKKRQVSFDSFECVGFFGKTRTIHPNFDLGVGVLRRHKGGLIGRVMWDVSHGYVSGFRTRDILYFVLTRSISMRIFNFVHRFECKPERGWTCHCYSDDADKKLT